MPILKFAENSKFSYKNLLDLNDVNKAYKSPLSVICHIDLNAFFAQCEQMRLGLSEDDPVVCVQWNSLIAVSYAARDYGITRMDRLEQAKLKCPNLIPAHTAVFKKGQPLWKYVDYMPSPVNHKVSLDPYRREGKKILNIFKNSCDLVEKASVDESFMDLGRLVFKRVLKLFPDILDGMENNTQNLKSINKLPDGLEFKGFVISNGDDLENSSNLVDEEHNFTIKDWDDIVILIGSNICWEIRKQVQDKLGYKTSGGVGRVKTIAKLASGFKKPNQQTIVRNDSIPEFLTNFKLTDFWSLGGKTGDYVKERLVHGTSISDIRDNYSSPLILSKSLDDNIDLSKRIFALVRGEYADKLEAREHLKSMASNKNFRGKSVSKTSDLLPWISVFVGELVLRIQELDEENGSIFRPVKFTLSVRNSFGIRHSKQCTINQSPRDYNALHKFYFDTSKDLLNSLETTWRKQSPHNPMYPLTNASLSVSTFIDNNGMNTLDDLLPTVQKRKNDSTVTDTVTQDQISNIPKKQKSTNTLDTFFVPKEEKLPKTDNVHQPITFDDRICSLCGDNIPEEEWQLHGDYHVAFNLEQKINKDFEESYGDILLKRIDRNAFKDKSNSPKDKSQSKLPF